MTQEAPDKELEPNAEVDYVDYKTGKVLFTLPFYDPGIPMGYLAYSCGRPLRRK